MHFDFDIDEFLAYLLPGALVVILIYSIFGADSVRDVLNLKFFEPEYTRALLGLSAYLGLTLAAGHVASLWSRIVVQPLIRVVVGNPKKAIFGGSDKAFYTPELRKAISDKFANVFKFSLETAGEKAAPLMIRAHVLQHSSAAVTIRERVVRARSLCGNLTFPLIMFVVLLIYRGYWLFAAVPFAIAVLLAVKQHLLDRREYRAINSYFVAT
jgi:hypothetical protein